MHLKFLTMFLIYYLGYLYRLISYLLSENGEQEIRNIYIFLSM